jgi:hypothetical protein
MCELFKFTFVGKQMKQKEINIKHYKVVSGIKFTFVGNEKKQMNGNINQILYGLARSIISV